MGGEVRVDVEDLDDDAIGCIFSLLGSVADIDIVCIEGGDIFDLKKKS